MVTLLSRPIRAPGRHAFLARLLLRLSSSSSLSGETASVSRHRATALSAARHAITDYLHSTRSLPFSHAELIASLSPSSLSHFLSCIPSPPPSPSSFPSFLSRFLSRSPINEFDFFFESIGLLSSPSPTTFTPSLFLSDDPPLLPAVSTLAHFGFPWSRLGVLYRADPNILHAEPSVLLSRLQKIEDELAPSPRVAVIATCLSSPFLLGKDFDDEVRELVKDLRCVFAVPAVSEQNDIDVLVAVCKTVKMFTDSGVRTGMICENSSGWWKVVQDAGDVEMEKRLQFFHSLGMTKEEAGKFLFERLEAFDLDLDNTILQLEDYLSRVGLSNHEVEELADKYPFVMGRNRLRNLPASLKAIGLDDWFLQRILDPGGLRYLLPEFTSIVCCNLKMESEFSRAMEKLSLKVKPRIINERLKFLLSIGFGENPATIRCLSEINGTQEHLQQRFECLLKLGIGRRTLCRMMWKAPKILNQSKEMLIRKMKYLTDELRYPPEYITSFPSFLRLDLGNRIKPRYLIINWLQEHGLLKKPFTPSTLLSISERKFVANLYRVHPAAPKQWLERFSSRNHPVAYYRRNMFPRRPQKFLG